MAESKIPDDYFDRMLSGEKPVVEVKVGIPQEKGGDVSQKKAQRNIYISKGIWKDLRRYSVETGQSVSSIIESLVIEFLKKAGR